MRHARVWLWLGVAALATACGGDEPPPPEVVRPVRAMQVPDPAPAELLDRF